MAAYADDVAWLCERLRLHAPVLVGHSMGGAVALEIAARHPRTAQCVVMIDGLLFPPSQLEAAFQQLIASVAGPDYVAAANGMLASLSLPTDAYGRRVRPSDSLHAPQHVVLSSLRLHTTDYSLRSAASACKLPVAYINATKTAADVDELRRLAPQLQVGAVLGAGHFCHVEAPEQVNAMIVRFVQLHQGGAAQQGAGAADA